MQRTFDALNSPISSEVFAEAYRATIPVLADAKHVTVRMTSGRAKELSRLRTDVSDVVEFGEVTEEIVNLQSGLKGTASKVRVIAVPMTVHVKDGAEVVVDDSADPSKISFLINGNPEVEIINLALSPTEQAAKDKASAAVQVRADQNAHVAFDKDLAAAREAGRKEALLKQAKEEGAASVTEGPKPTVQ